MLLLLHALIPCTCLAGYILPSSPVLMHIYCICFSTFWHCHLTSFNILMEMFYSLVSLVFHCIETVVCQFYVSIKAYNSTIQLLALRACRRNPYIYKCKNISLKC